MKYARHVFALTVFGLVLSLVPGPALSKGGWKINRTPIGCNASVNERGWSVSFLIKPETPEKITLEFEAKNLYPGLWRPEIARLRLFGSGKWFAALFATRGPGGLIMEFQRTAELNLVLGLSGWFQIVSGNEQPQEVLIPGDVAGVFGRFEQCLSKRS